MLLFYVVVVVIVVEPLTKVSPTTTTNSTLKKIIRSIVSRQTKSVLESIVLQELRHELPFSSKATAMWDISRSPLIYFIPTTSESASKSQC